MARKFSFWQNRKQHPRKSHRGAAGRRRHNNSVGMISLNVELLEDRRLLAAGDLDTTFNPAGTIPGIKIGQFAPFGVGADGDEGVVTAVQADGKIVVATQQYLTGFNVNFDVLVARYNANGSADTSFGTGGSTSFDFTSGQSLVTDLAIDSLGRIVVVGSGPSGSSTGFTAARLTASGILDTSFDTDGKVSNNFGNVQSSAWAVAIQADNKIVVGGVAGVGTAGNFGLVRFNVNGSLDDGGVNDSTPADSFGTSGRVTTDFFGHRDIVNSLAIQNDGKIVAVGIAATGANPAARDFALARYNMNGTLDTTFDVDGKATTNVVTTALVPGITFSEDFAYSVKLQSDGKIVVAGYTTVRTGPTDDTDMVVARYNTNGALDATFVPDATRLSVAGTHRVQFAISDYAKDILIQPDGKYVLVGMVNTNVSGPGNFTIATARLVNNDLVLPDGTLDVTYSGDGKQQTSLGASYLVAQSRVYDAALQPDGKIVVVGAGDQTANPSMRDYVIARYESGLATQSISGPPTVNESATYTLTTTSSDPTTTQWTINWGDSVQVVPGNPSSVTHVYADGPQNYTISATVTTITGTAPVLGTVAVTVLNVSPTLAISGAANVNEGATYTLNLSSSDPGPDTISQWTINWGDSMEVVPGNPTSVTHVYADGANNYTISASATDEDGTFGVGNTVSVSILNVAPTLAISGAPDVTEGASYTLNLSSFDPGADTISQWTINWGDSTDIVFGNPTSVSHTYADGDANYTISATAMDEDGTFAAGNMVALAVLNVAPALAISGAADVDEGANYSLNLSSLDPGTDIISQWTINWGDSIEVVMGNPSSVAHTYADGAASHTISATATDEDGTFAAGNTVGVTVHDVAPTLAISGASDVDEGASYTLSLSSSDPGSDTISQWTINWGDSVQVVSGSPASVLHTYADGDASYTISATATDEDGTYAAGNTVAALVHNVAPTLVISGTSDVDEGSSYTLDLSSSDPGTDTISQWIIDWGDSTEVVSGNPTSVSHTYADGDASYTISATATDEDDTFAAGNTLAVAVLNVAPALAISGTADVDEAASYALNLTSSDPGADTISQWTINWGDSTEVVSGNPSSVSHTYADGDASYTISATATDEDGTFIAGNTVAVTVHNVAPTLAISGAADADEGSTYTLTLSSSDPGTDTISQWTINWGDGTEIVSGNPAGVSHTYADGNASYTISAMATDEDGVYAAGNTVAVSVHNVAPSLALSGGSSVYEGSSYALTLASSDPGTDTISQWTINWGDSVQIVSGNPTGVSHTYVDGTASYTISATATDEDGTYAAGNSIAVTVLNVAAVLAISGAATVNEGSSYTLNLFSSDPGADTISQWTINWGDSTQVVTGNPTSVSHTYVDGAASYTISATATDEDGTYAAGNTVAVTVNNVAPTLAISGASSVGEGSSYTLNLSSTDPGADTISQWTINWGDSTQVVSGHPASVTHTYADGTVNRTISATATDEDGTYAAGNTVSVTVNNVAPTLAISGASSVNEGSSYTLNLSSADPGADTISQWTINWGDSTQVVSGNPASVTHVYADGNASSNYTISATATDEDGTYAAGNTVAVTVVNVAPTSNPGGPYQTFDDTPIMLSGTGTDPAGAADPLSFAWDLDGDNIFGESGAGATRGNEVGANVTYNPAGLPVSTQTVKLRVNDGDGGVTTATTTVQVIGQGTVLAGGVLYIVGSNTANDIVIITQCDDTIIVLATFNANNPMSFSASAVTEIQVRTRGGNDIAVTTPNVNKLMTIDGGSGNDLLTGGSGRNVIIGGTGNDVLYGAGGNDILLGGDGNDDLFGGSGNDVLVGGNGCDYLNGGSGRDVVIGSQDEDELRGGDDEDVLVGGWTVHDNNVAALDAVMAIWSSSASFSARVATLSGTGGMLQGGVTVFDDDDNDEIVGGAGRDLIFGDTYRWDGAIDQISLQTAQDILVAVN